jgi:hypothetical protein
MIGPSLGYYYVNEVNEQWREAAAFVQANASPDDVIVFAPNEVQETEQQLFNMYYQGIEQRTFDLYYQGTSPNCGLSNQVQDPNTISAALTQCVSGYKRFWVIIRKASDYYSQFSAFFGNPNQTALTQVNSHQFSGVSVYLFESHK